MPSTPWTVCATLGDILENAHLSTEGKILNGLEFPQWKGHLASPQFASDLVAWEHTAGLHKTPLNFAYPLGNMNWSLVGTANTVTFLHIDADGINTGINIKCRKKVWGILKDTSQEHFMSINAFTALRFALDSIDSQSPYQLEAIVLMPNNML